MNDKEDVWQQYANRDVVMRVYVWMISDNLTYAFEHAFQLTNSLLNIRIIFDQKDWKPIDRFYIACIEEQRVTDG